MSHRRNIPVLPDSTGRRIVLRHHLEVAYTGAASLTAFRVGDRVVGASSNTIGIVSRVVTNSVAAGTLIITLDSDNEDNDYTSGENLLIGGTTIAQAGASIDVYSQATTTVSYDNPHFGQKVDRDGAAHVRFTEGPLERDAYGRARTSTSTPLGKYDFNYDALPSLFASSSVGGGAVTFESGTSAVLLSADTSSGSLGTYTSNLNHKFFAGQSQYAEMAVALSEDGKAAVRRRWGLFDTNDGVYFESSGTTKSVVVRSSVNGTVTEHVTSQSQWSEDTLDGTNGSNNISDIQLDYSKTNLYWIDFQAPIGTIRFGIIDQNGLRRVVHRHTHINSDTIPTMRRTGLPFRWEVENLEAAASTSELRAYSSRVWTEGSFSDAGDVLGLHTHTSGSVSVDTSETYLFSLRPRTTFKGQRNKIVALFEDLSVCVLSGSVEGFAKINMWVSPILVGSTFNILNGFSSLEIDEDASSHTGFIKIGEFYVHGKEKIDLREVSNYSSTTRLSLDADDTQPTISFTAQSLVSGSVNDVYTNLVWREIID